METMKSSDKTPLIDDNISLNIRGWMINHLDLSTKALLLFSTIYSFSKNLDGCYYGTIEYSGAIMKGATKPTVIEAYKDMIDKGYITKSKKTINGKRLICYTPTDEVKKFDPQGQITLPNEVKKINPQGQKILPNNNRDNKDNNKVINSAAGKKAKGLSIEPSYDIEEYERQANEPLRYIPLKERAAQENEQPQQ